MSFDVEMDQVTMSYGKTDALKSISLRLESSGIYGLIGRNGAGKSTLLSLLASFMQPTEGAITIGGQNPFENRSVMPHVTFVYDADYREETEKVKGMLQAAERYRPHFDRQYADELANLFQLPLNKQVKELSHGMQSALNVTIGLASRSEITIFDEAYLGMDAPSRELFYQHVVEDHATHPRTIILSTHLVSEMEYLFEEVVILDKGEVILTEPMDKLKEQGVSITGGIKEVDAFTQGMKQLNTRQLGGTKSVMVYGEMSKEKRKEAARSGLEVGSVSLQDLFIHLTSEEHRNETI